MVERVNLFCSSNFYLESVPKPCKIACVVGGAFILIAGCTASGLLFPHIGTLAFVTAGGGICISVPPIVLGSVALKSGNCVYEFIEGVETEEKEVETKLIDRLETEEVETCEKKRLKNSSVDSDLFSQSFRDKFKEKLDEISKKPKIPKLPVVKLKISCEKDQPPSLKGYICAETHRVFELPLITPGIIYKLDIEKNQNMQKRFNNIEMAKRVIRENKLNVLYIPDASLSDEEIEGYLILAEKKLPLASADDQEMLWAKYADQLDEAVRQMTVFICKTGWDDAVWRNMAIYITEEGIKIALIDLDDIYDRERNIEDWKMGVTFGLFGMNMNQTVWRRGLIRCVEENQFAIVVSEAKKQITEDLWGEMSLDHWADVAKERRREDIQKRDVK